MKYKLLFISVFLALHQVNAAELELAGSLAGDSSVDSLGVLSHTIPLVIPPSINSFTPHLNLSYNGQSPDRILGVGWNITGLSSIGRCNEIEKINFLTNIRKLITPREASHQENIIISSPELNLFPLYTNSCFALDGQKMVMISPDSASAEKTEFRLEDDDFTKITVEIGETKIDSGESIKSISKFIVKQKDGTVKEYSSLLKFNKKNNQTSEYEVDSSRFSGIFEWGLTSVKDNNGNYWTVEYQDLNKGLLYPKSIKYTGNSGTSSVAPNNSIDFEYMDRSIVEKKQGYNQQGSTLILDKKLSKLSIKSNNVVRGEYRFQYEDITDQVANKTRLKDIKYCTVNGTVESCQIPTKLEWSSYGKDVMTTPLRDTINKIPDVKVNETLNSIRMNTRKSSTTKELIFLAKMDNSLKLYSNPVDPQSAPLADILTHSSLSSFQQWSPTVMDVNADGISDLVIYGRNSVNQISLLLFTSSFDQQGKRQFTFYKEHKNIFTTPAPLLNISTLDGDRDGITDLVILTGDKSDIRFNGIRMDAQGNVTFVNTTTIGPNIRNALNASSGKRTPIMGHILSGNFKQSKTHDIIFYYTNVNGLNLCSVSIYQDILQTIASQTIDECGTTNSILINGAAGDAYKDYDFSVVDFNGDGLDDIVMSKVIRLDAANGPATRFHERLVPLLSTGNMILADTGFEVQPAIDLPIFTINTDQKRWITDWETQWSVPTFTDFNHDGFIDLYRYSKAFSPKVIIPTELGAQPEDDGKLRYQTDLISYLQRPNKKFDVFKSNLSNWWRGISATDEILLTTLGMPNDIKTDDYIVEYIPIFSDINNNGFQEINFQFIARQRTGNGAYIYSYISQAAKQDVDLMMAGMSDGLRWSQLRNPVVDFQDMLKSIDSGDGLKKLFNYTNFSQSPDSIEARAFPIRGSDSASLVSSSVMNYLNGVLGSKSTYLYSSPRVDVKDNRFLGFETTTETLESYNKNASGNDVTDKLVKETVFNQNYPFTGMAKSVVTKANDALVSKLTVADADFVSDSA
ncbi:hypothetical protein R5L37_19300, partial [Acinetobacter pittii]